MFYLQRTESATVLTPDTDRLGHSEFLLIEPDMKKCRAIPLSHVNTLPLIVSALRGWLASHMQQGGSAGSKKKFIRKSS